MTTQKSKLPKNIIAIGAVSFFTDVSTEMIYPLLPLFLGTVLHANASFIGAIEGVAESTAALLKLAGGWWSDRVSKRKPLVVLGYGISSFVRPFVAIAQSSAQVLAIRVGDRVGKGIRTSPRDALLAESTNAENRGRAFGFHAAADNAGAVLGPLTAFAVLSYFHTPLRKIFWLAAIPGILAFLVLIFFVREISSYKKPGDKTAPDLSVSLGKRFWYYLIVLFIFTLGCSTDAFLLLRANQLGVPIALAPLLWALLNFVKASMGTYGGALSDRIGRRPLIIAGWLWYAGVYFAFARATETWHAWALFGVYGLFYALTEGAEKALVVDMVPPHRKGAALGWYNLTVGLGALPASLIFGAVWDKYSSGAAFTMGAILALAASVGLTMVIPPKR